MQMSDKHGPRLADDLTKDTRAGHEELREAEPDGRRVDLTIEEEGVLDGNVANERAELARFLEPSAFPARAEELVAVAEGNFATDEVLDRLRMLPDGRYENVQQVWAALGGEVETKRA
jgi:hypothetical protein